MSDKRPVIHLPKLPHPLTDDELEKIRTYLNYFTAIEMLYGPKNVTLRFDAANKPYMWRN